MARYVYSRSGCSQSLLCTNKCAVCCVASNVFCCQLPQCTCAADYYIVRWLPCGISNSVHCVMKYFTGCDRPCTHSSFVDDVTHFILNFCSFHIGCRLPLAGASAICATCTARDASHTSLSWYFERDKSENSIAEKRWPEPFFQFEICAFLLWIVDRIHCMREEPQKWRAVFWRFRKQKLWTFFIEGLGLIYVGTLTGDTLLRKNFKISQTGNR